MNSILALLTVVSLGSQNPGSAHLMIVTGLGGEPGYRRELSAWSDSLVAGAGRLGVPTSNILYLAGDSIGMGVRRATRENVITGLRDLAKRSRSGDAIILFFAGHGSHEGVESRLNLPGPDLTAADLAAELPALAGRRLVVVNAASASGDFVAALSGQGRVIITATKSAFERNATRFGGHFAIAFAGSGADADKDGRVSVLEAFLYAKRETARMYESDNRLLTEHAVLDDDGDKSGSSAPGSAGTEGALARTIFLSAVPAAVVPADAATAALVTEKRQLEKRIADLRGRKASMREAEYEAQLETLLVELALKNEALRGRRAP